MATTARFTNNIGPINQGTDKTDRIFTNQYLNPAYIATLAVVPKEARTLIQGALLTGAQTINIGVGTSTSAPFVGDVIQFLFSADATGRTVTFGTGTAPSAATLVLPASKKGYAEFMFDGAVWVETSRTIQA